MFRVFLLISMVMALSGCSMGTSSITSGFASPTKTASIKPRLKNSRSLGGEPGTSQRRGRSTKARQKLASLGKPSKRSGVTSNNRRKGSRAGRIKSVRLDVERARVLINNYRRTRGLKLLTLDVQLTKAAKAHSRDLARWDRISHYGSDGSSPWDRVKRAGFNAKLAAENVGTGQANIDEVFKGWQKSSGHNKNLLLADADNMGIALVHDPKTEFKTFWTLVIGSRL